MDNVTELFVQQMNDALEQFNTSQQDYSEDQSGVVFNACFMGDTD